jgi:hypothetical protein
LLTVKKRKLDLQIKVMSKFMMSLNDFILFNYF